MFPGWGAIVCFFVLFLAMSNGLDERGVVADRPEGPASEEGHHAPGRIPASGVGDKHTQYG